MIVPAFREGRVIGGVVGDLVAAGYRVVVVDDGSGDDTASVASAAGGVLLRHAINVGQGAALRTGFAHVLRRTDTRFVVTFDADGQHHVSDIAQLVAPLQRGTADVVLGSRFLGSASQAQIPALRRTLLRMATALARRSTGLRLTDTHNGLRAFTVDALRRLDLQQDRMAHASELLSEIARTGCRVEEVPVEIRYTTYSLAKGQRLIDAVSILWDQTTSRLR